MNFCASIIPCLNFLDSVINYFNINLRTCGRAYFSVVQNMHPTYSQDTLKNCAAILLLYRHSPKKENQLGPEPFLTMVISSKNMMTFDTIRALDWDCQIISTCFISRWHDRLDLLNEVFSFCRFYRVDRI